MNTEARETRTGELLNKRYLLLECLESTPSADTYLAADQSGPATVSVKLLRPEFVLQPGVVERFVSLARSVSGLGHASVPRVLSVQSDETGIPFVVEEQCPGNTLSQMLAKSPEGLAPELVFTLLLPIVEAMARAHDHGVVHGRISSGSVAVADSEGRPIPKLLGLFSPSIPDEEKKGARDDVRSLGFLFFEMLTGEIMLDETGECIRDLSADELDSLLRKKKGLTEELYEVIRRCLAENADERPETADELLFTLIGAQQRSSMPGPGTGGEGAAPATGEAEPPEAGKDKSYWSLSPYMEGGGPREERPVPLKKPAKPLQRPVQKAPPDPPKPAPPDPPKPAPPDPPKPAPVAPAPEARKPRIEPRKPTPVPAEKPPQPAIAISPREILALADFGEVPSSPLYALPYAVRVFRRRRALQKEIGERRSRGSAAIGAAESALHKLGESLYKGQGLSSIPPILKPFMDEIDRIEESRERKSLVFEETSKEADNELAALKADLEEAKAKADALQGEEDGLKEKLAGLTAGQKELEASKAGIKDQLDSLRTSTGKVEEQRLAALQAEHGGKAKESDDLGAEISRQNQKIAKLHRQIELHAGMVRVLTQQLGAMTSSKQLGEKGRRSAFETVEEDIRKEMIALARTALHPDLVSLVSSPQIVAEAQTALVAETKAAYDIALCERAMASHDPKMYNYGLYTLFAGAGLLVLLVILLSMP